MEQEFKVKIESFEGPLDLLLQLIERHKIHISDVSLSKVADDFIAYIKNLADLPKREMADFLVIASTLVLIKSLTLLPTLETTPEESQDISDLKKRLALFKKIKESAEKIKDSFGRKIIFFREESKIIEPVFTPSEDINKNNLHEAIFSVLKSVPKKEILPEVAVKKVISLEEVIDNLTKRVQSAISMSFKEFTKEAGAKKADIIVSFLGMLELVKQGIIDAKQEKIYEDISMESSGTDVPRYN